MVLHNTKTRKMVKDVNHDAIAAIDFEINRVVEWKSVGRRDKTQLLAHLKKTKQSLLDGHEGLMVYFQPTPPKSRKSRKSK